MVGVAKVAGAEMLAVARQLEHLSPVLALKLALKLVLVLALALKRLVVEVERLHSQLMEPCLSRETAAKRRIEIAELLAVESEQITQLD